MDIPTTLKHKPVIISDNYGNVDGRMAYHTDAKGLSLGLAQWNERGRLDISAKVWRHTGGKWSRQSEELPLHRVLDLTLLICSAKRYLKDSYRRGEAYDRDNPVFERIALQGDALTAAVCVDNPYIGEDIRLFEQALQNDDEMLSERLHRLGAMLLEMGYVRGRGAGSGGEG